MENAVIKSLLEYLRVHKNGRTIIQVATHFKISRYQARSRMDFVKELGYVKLGSYRRYKVVKNAQRA